MIRHLIPLVTIALVVTLLPRAEAVLVAHYEFESSSDLGIDSAGGDNNGVQQGTDSTFSPLSRLGNGALALDGTGVGLRLDNPADFQELTSFTIAAFVRPDLNSATWGGGSVEVGRVFGSVGVDGPGGTPFGDGNGYGFGLLRDGTVSGLRYTSFLVQDYNVFPADLSNPLQDDQWAHVAVVVDEGNAEFFIDGTSVATIEGSNANPTTNPFHVGASGGGNSDSFAGLLDDVRVYDEALDAAAVADLSNPAGTGQQGLVFSIDRDLGAVTLTNDTGFDTQIRGYSLTSDSGRFNAGDWSSIAENYDQGNGGETIDPDDDWLEFSSTAGDLSEGTQGEVTLTGGQSVELGNAWRKGPFETDDLSAEILLADGTTVPALVEFTGNGGEPYKLGDLDFDNDVDLEDFALYNDGLFTSSIDVESTDPYLLGDLDGDFDNDFFDFLAFKSAFIAEGGNPAALRFATAVPEPTSIAMLALCGLGLACCGHRRVMRRVSMLVVFGASAVATTAHADLEPVLEYSFPASYDGSGTAVADLSGAGNNATLDGTAPVVDDRPSGFDSSLMSLTGSNGGHGATEAIDLLENAVIDDHGGFVMDVWLKWEGDFTDVRKQIDYAGTEYLRTSDGNAQFGLSDGATVLSHPIEADQWYHVQGVFDSRAYQTDANGDLLGNAYLVVDDEVVDSAFGVTKTAFGDSLDRPIGINRWAGGGADWNQGWIFDPAVYLGRLVVPEPASATLWVVAAAGAIVATRRRSVHRTLGVGLLLATCLAGRADAQFTPVLEYSFPDSYDASSTAVTDLSTAGNNATLDGTAPLVDDRPAGFDASLMSISGSNGGHGATDAIDLLENAVIDDHGGFVMDTWLKWEGEFADVRKQIDYAGTEYLRTFGGNAQFGLSNGAFVLSHPINGQQWYHVQGVFDSGSNQTDENGDLVGDAFLYVDGALVDSAFGITKTAFGDSLDRPIGINRWAGGGGDWNQGNIFNPAVYLGAVDEPMRLEVDTASGEVRVVHLPGDVLPDARDIDFYQISSDSGSLSTGTWNSLDESQFDATAGGGDYNGDGSVDAADYTVWRDSLGATGADLAADGNDDQVVDDADYTIWKNSFGTSRDGAAWTEAGQFSSSLVGESFLTGSSLFDDGRSVSLGQLWDENSTADPTADLVFQYHVAGENGLRTGAIDLVAGNLQATTSVPEPSAVVLVAAFAAVFTLLRRRPRLVAVPMGAGMVLLSLASTSLALVSNDRLYPMGEAAGDGGADGVYVVDSEAQATFDDEYDGGNLSGTAHDLIAWQFDGDEATLAPSGAGPQFVDVSGRPLAGGGTQLGVRFDGVDDLLIGARLGLPQTSASSQASTSTPPTSGNAGPFDYQGVTNRGYQMWVNPDENNAVFGTEQQAVVLDTNQHGVLISEGGNWTLRYDGVDIESEAPVKTDAEDNGWSHVMVVQPDTGPFGGGGRLYIDGVAVAARNGGYLAGDDSPLVIGANTGAFDPTAQAPDPVFAGGTDDYFAGVVDQMNMFVLGENLSGTDYGSFDLLEHNEYVASELAGYGAGDLTGDGVADETDVNAFVAGWGTVNLVNDIPVGDLNSRLAGDFNLDGTVGIDDWQILVDNYTGTGALHLGQLLSARAVPEPPTVAVALLSTAVAVALLRRRPVGR